MKVALFFLPLLAINLLANEPFDKNLPHRTRIIDGYRVNLEPIFAWEGQKTFLGEKNVLLAT